MKIQAEESGEQKIILSIESIHYLRKNQEGLQDRDTFDIIMKPLQLV